MSLTTSTVLTGTFGGRNGAGSVTLTGAQVGDLAIILFDAVGSVTYGASFESIISVADEIQQIGASNLTGYTFKVLLVRAATTVCCISA